jgi:hypothetical protein
MENLTPFWGLNQGTSSIRVVAPHPRNLRKIKYLNKGSSYKIHALKE